MNVEALRQAIQKIASDAVAAANPSDYCIGVVETASPLTIRLNQQEEPLTEDFLVLTDAVRDHYVDMTVAHTTENRAGGGGDAEYASHNHDYTGRKKFLVHRNLAAGESVILIRQAGGQEFIVLSRLYDATNLSGQWGG